MSASVVARAGALGALTAAGQLLLVGTLPLYSRVFEPGAYGQYVIFVGTAGIVGVLAGLRYDSAIVLPRNDRIAGALTALVLLIACLVAALMVLAVLVSAPVLASHGTLSAARHFGLGLAAATLIGALQRCLTSWCVRQARFLQIGIGQFGLSLVTVVAQLLLVRVAGPLSALVWGYVMALGVQSACLATPRLTRVWLGGMSWRAIRIAARKYRRFPGYMVGYALASTLRDRLIQIMLGIGAGAAAVGRFGLAYRVAFAPNSLIYSAVSPIFYAIASRGTKGAVGRFAAGLVEAGFIMLVVPYIVFAIEAPALTDELLSARWYGTGPYLRALAAPALMLAATCWLDRAFDSFRRQNVAFALEATFTVAAVGTVGALSRLLDPVAVTWVFGTMGVIYYWTYFLMVFVSCGFPRADFGRACLNGALAAAVTLIVAAAAHRLQQPSWRVMNYAALYATVVATWIRFCGGAAILGMLIRSRVGDQHTTTTPEW
jgi:O-antigen/teichoic acid export membrane protein